MSWIRGWLEGVVDSRGRITATFSDMEVVEGHLPKNGEEFGANPEALQALNERVPTSFATLARLGAGVAVVLQVACLKWARDAWVPKLAEKFGEYGPQGLLCLLQDLGAGGTWLCADVCAGVPTVTNIFGGAFTEIVELGLFKPEGWGKFVLPGASDYQSLVNNEQEREWADHQPNFPSGMEIPVDIPSFTMVDEINGIDTVLSGEPGPGSIEAIVIASAKLPNHDWLVRDIEHIRDNDGNAKFALNRHPAVICPRPGKSPLMFQFGPSGLDINTPVIPLSGEALDLCVNRKVETVLRALDWLS